MSARNAHYAPDHTVLARVPPGSTGIDPNAAPSQFFAGMGIQDHRLPYNSKGSSANQPALVGWYGAGLVMVANYVPATIATANIAALANAVSGTAMTLRSSTGAGITVLSTSAPAVFQPTGLSVSAGVAIDGLPGLQTFGTGGAGSFNTAFYDRSKTTGRAVSITGVAGGAGGHFIVAGYDVYGYAQTENINATAGATTTNGAKTWKAITSVTPQFSDAHNYSVGTADIYGFGLYTAVFGDVFVNWNSTLITASTGYTAGVTSAPSPTTGDVRGTYATQDASDGTKRLVMYVSPSLASIASNATTGLFGQTPA
jgi:hypothetical protein